MRVNHNSRWLPAFNFPDVFTAVAAALASSLGLSAGATTVFNGTGFAFIDPEGSASAGPNGGTLFEFDGVSDGIGLSGFFNVGYTSPTLDPVPGGDSSGTLRVTARQAPGNDPLSQIFVLLGEPNPDFIFEGVPTPRRELHSYQLITGDFSDTEYTAIDIPLSNTFSIQSTNLDGGEFSTNGVGENPTQEFDVRGVDLVLFQNEFFNTVGDVALEVLTVEIISAVSALEGDYDTSGGVDQGDLDIVLLNWGTANFTGDAAALPGGGPFDGAVDQNELDGVLLNWGNTSEAAGSALPEPAGAALLGLGGLALLRRRVD